MVVHTIKLNNSILGWMMVHTARVRDTNVYELLSELYGTDYAALNGSERAVMKGAPVADVLAEIRRVARDIGASVSVCGNREQPTLRVWWDKTTTLTPEKRTVDLKWSLWMQDEDVWNEYAPDLWARMEAAFTGAQGPVCVWTAPRKETRSGWVIIGKGGASGLFVSEWDEFGALANTLGQEDDWYFRECIPYSQHADAPGCERSFTVRARSFASLMRKIDDEESELLGEDAQVWQDIESMFKGATVGAD